MTACRVCATEFPPQRMGQQVCGVRCAQRLPVVARKADKAQQRRDKAKLDAIKPRSHWLKQAQDAFNAWVRALDVKAGRGCISCGTHNGKMNAGHYRSVGSSPELRFEPKNCHLQCERCNTYLHGNLIEYRAALMKRNKYAVEWLEGPHEPKHYSTDELRTMAAEWRKQTRELLR